MEALIQSASIGREGDLPSASDCAQLCFNQLQRSYEPDFGGFSKAPKFPQPANMNFLLRLHVHGGLDESDSRKALDMCLYTLGKMAKGGIFDHVNLVRIYISNNLPDNVGGHFALSAIRVLLATRPT